MRGRKKTWEGAYSDHFLMRRFDSQMQKIRNAFDILIDQWYEDARITPSIVEDCFKLVETVESLRLGIPEAERDDGRLYLEERGVGLYHCEQGLYDTYREIGRAAELDFLAASIHPGD